VKVHFHYIVRYLKSKMSTLPAPGKMSADAHVWNTSLVMCLHGCAIACGQCATKQAFAQCRIFRGNTAQHIFFSCFNCVNAEMLNKAISGCDKFTLWDKKAGGMNLAKTCAFCVRCKSPSDTVDGQRGAAKRFFSFIPP